MKENSDEKQQQIYDIGRWYRSRAGWRYQHWCVGSGQFRASGPDAGNLCANHNQAIIPINDIINRYEAEGGRITDIELDRELFRDVYELELIDANGQGWDIDIDARSGEELSKYKDWD